MRKALLLFLLFPILVSSQKIKEYDHFIIVNGDTANQYVNGKKHGLWFEYDEVNCPTQCFRSRSKLSCSINGVYQKGKYNEGIKIGTWLEKHRDSKIAEYSYNINGEKDYKIYYYQSHIYSIRTWKDGKPYRLVYLYKNGALKFKANYIDVQIGNFEAYYENGQTWFKGRGNGENIIRDLHYFEKDGNSREYRAVTVDCIIGRISVHYRTDPFKFIGE